MSEHHNALPIPASALEDARGVEILRVWAAAGKQHVSLATGLWKDPASWGIMLTDLARHVARAYEQNGGMRCEEALRRIRVGLDAEWGSPTDSPSGGIGET